jgi:hypothetical protein
MDWQKRTPNGVAIRRDGKGDSWANDHRSLGQGWNMRDEDETHRCVWEIDRRENLRFLEMNFDSYENKGKLIRKCGTLCRVDRKATVWRAEKEIDSGAVSIAHMLQECRNDRAMQGGIGGRAFLACGKNYPYTYIELDPFSGEELRREILADSSGWHDLYERLGLESEKSKLQRWLLTQASKEPTDG